MTLREWIEKNKFEIPSGVSLDEGGIEVSGENINLFVGDGFVVRDDPGGCVWDQVSRWGVTSYPDHFEVRVLSGGGDDVGMTSVEMSDYVRGLDSEKGIVI